MTTKTYSRLKMINCCKLTLDSFESVLLLRVALLSITLCTSLYIRATPLSAFRQPGQLIYLLYL